MIRWSRNIICSNLRWKGWTDRRDKVLIGDNYRGAKYIGDGRRQYVQNDDCISRQNRTRTTSIVVENKMNELS